jgi:4-hydroxy-tetrahydrodipicolinate reductase
MTWGDYFVEISRKEKSMDKITVCIAGATGWAGSALAKGVTEATDMELVSAVSRSHAGVRLDEALGTAGLEAQVFGSVDEALNGTRPDVFVEYTQPESAKGHVLSALRSGAHVVIGTSGLGEADYEEIAAAAEEAKRGVLAVGNFALTVVLLQKFAEMAARYIPHWEIIDYAHADKRDAPSGTARELANRLAKVREAALEVPLEQVEGPRESRGARLQGSQVHSVRLPGYVISLDAIFGMPGQTLVLRHESGTSAEPYVDGALLAIRKVGGLVGLQRGLDSVMGF